MANEDRLRRAAAAAAEAEAAAAAAAASSSSRSPAPAPASVRKRIAQRGAAEGRGANQEPKDQPQIADPAVDAAADIPYPPAFENGVNRSQ